MSTTHYDVRPTWLNRIARPTAIRYLAFVLMFAGAGSAVVYTRAATAAQPISNQASGSCLSGGDRVQVRACDSGDSQLWQRSQDGAIEQNKQCLGIDRQSGAGVALQPCDGSKYQRWHLDDRERLVNASAGTCLQPQNGDAGTVAAETAVCTDASAQRWHTNV